jgi:signal peptidase II
LKRLVHDYGFLLGIAGFIVFLDQLTKELVRRNLAFEEMWAPWEWLLPYARLVNWRNFGAAFGMFQNGRVVFTILGIVVSILIIYYFPRIPRQDRLLRLALAMQLGGALGNLIDRLTQGYVTDFISVGRFPVFNVADACISIGAVLLVVSVWLQDRDQVESEGATETSEAESHAQVNAGLNRQPVPEGPHNPQAEERADD